MKITEVVFKTELCWFDEELTNYIPPKDREIFWRMYAGLPHTSGDIVTLKLSIDIEMYPIVSEEKIMCNIKANLFATMEDDGGENETHLNLSMLLIDYCKMIYKDSQFQKTNYSPTFMSVTKDDVLAELKKALD